MPLLFHSVSFWNFAYKNVDALERHHQLSMHISIATYFEKSISVAGSSLDDFATGNEAFILESVFNVSIKTGFGFFAHLLPFILWVFDGYR